jgi:hypothetical protein
MGIGSSTCPFIPSLVETATAAKPPWPLVGIASEAS